MEILPAMRKETPTQVLDHIFSLAPPARIEETGLSRERLDNWVSLLLPRFLSCYSFFSRILTTMQAHLALNLKKIVHDYDPRYVPSRHFPFQPPPLRPLHFPHSIPRLTHPAVSSPAWTSFSPTLSQNSSPPITSRNGTQTSSLNGRLSRTIPSTTTSKVDTGILSRRLI